MSKANKRRMCPAVGREITSAECGENRNSRYQCPATCQFNLFAPENYSQLLEAEARLDDLSMQFLAKEPVHGDRIAQLVRKLDTIDPAQVNPFYCYELFIRRDDQGLTCMGRWENAGFPDLKNDLRCFAKSKMSTTVRLLEVQRVIDAEQVEYRDLLDPARGDIIVRDRTSAARACRYDVLLGFTYDLPFYSRITSGGVIIPFWGPVAGDDVVREIVRHLGGPTDPPRLPHWLAEHFYHFSRALWETAGARLK
jgi:hypothetical protein